MADFANFELGMNVSELADGLIPEMAEVFEVELSEQPTIEELSDLIGAVGTNKVLTENIERVQSVLGTHEDGAGVAADWLERSGVQQGIDRSLWIPYFPAPRNAVTVLSGNVANWQDRTTKLVGSMVSEGDVYIAVGQREMNAPTEKINANVQAFVEAYGKFPTETEYAHEVVKPRLQALGHEVVVASYTTTSGDVIAASFVDGYEKLFKGAIRFARNANAGILLAGQMVVAARAQGMEFDTDPTKPQAFVLTDEFPIARTEEERGKPAEFQNPLTGLRQVPVTAKMLTQLAQTA